LTRGASITSAGRAYLKPAAQLGPFGALALLVIGLPLVLLVTYSFRESSFLGVGGGPTLEQYKLVFDSPDTVRVMLKTFYLALAIAAIATSFAFVIAYALSFRMGRRAALITLGIVVASGIASFLVRIFAWGIVLGPNGLINGALERVGLIDAPLGFLYFGRFAIAVAMVYVYLPIAVLITYSSMQGIDPCSVEASRDLGAGRWRTIFRVVGPQARTGVLAAFAVTLMLASGDFVTPRIVGGTSGVTVGSAVQDQAQIAGDLPGAAALALSFVGLEVCGLLVIAAAIRLARPLIRGIGRRLGPVAGHIGGLIPTRSYRRSISLPLTGALLIYLIVPTILVIVFSFNSSSSIGPPLTGLTGHWYPYILGRVGFSDALHGTVFVALIATLGALVIGIPVAFALLRLRGAWARLVWLVVLFPFIIPAALLGPALLVTSSETGFPLGFGLTILVHVMLLVSVIVIVVYARLEGIDVHVLEAARDLGASAWRTMRTVTVPLLLPSILGGAVLAAAVSLDEVFVTQFTIGTNNTIPIWLLGQARRGVTPGVYALGVLVLTGTLVAFTVALLLARRSILAVRGQ
jgi:putative spermidine/putrescine transport system permease protein